MKRFFIVLTFVFAFLITPLAAYADVIAGPELVFSRNPAIIIVVLIAIVVVVTILLVTLHRKRQGKK